MGSQLLCCVILAHTTGSMPFLIWEKVQRLKNKPAADYFVESGTENIRRSGCNLTCDNSFTSVPVALKLAEQGLTIIGTIRKNKPELPKEFVDSKYTHRHN